MPLRIEDLSAFPELISYIESEPPNPTLIEWQIHPVYIFDIRYITVSYNVLQLLTILGKTEHIRKLPLSDTEKKEAVKAAGGKQSTGYCAIQYAALNGDLTMVQYLESLLTEAEKKQAVQGDYFLAILNAVERGHLGMVQYLESHLSMADKKEAVLACNASALSKASRNGDLEMIRHLFSHVTDAEIKESMRANHFYAISLAAQTSHLTMFKYLETYVTDAEKKQVVKNNRYYNMQKASRNGDLAMIQHLETYLTEKEKKEAVKAGDYIALMLASDRGYYHIIEYFARYDNALNYIEKNHSEYSRRFTIQYVNNALDALSIRRAAFSAHNPHGVFDIENYEVARTFIILRHLIRRNQAEDLPTIQSLLSIPKLREASHLSYVDRIERWQEEPFVMKLVDEAGSQNELLKLARTVGNIQAVKALLTIPMVNAREFPLARPLAAPQRQVRMSKRAIFTLPKVSKRTDETVHGVGLWHSYLNL